MDPRVAVLCMFVWCLPLSLRRELGAKADAMGLVMVADITGYEIADMSF